MQGPGGPAEHRAPARLQKSRAAGTACGTPPGASRSTTRSPARSPPARHACPGAHPGRRRAARHGPPRAPPRLPVPLHAGAGGSWAALRLGARAAAAPLPACAPAARRTGPSATHPPARLGPCALRPLPCCHVQREARICYVARDKAAGVPHHAKAGNINSALLKEGPGRVRRLLGGRAGQWCTCACGSVRPGQCSMQWCVCACRPVRPRSCCLLSPGWRRAPPCSQGDFILILDCDMGAL